MKKIFLLSLIAMLPAKIFAQTTQFYLEDKLGSQKKARIYLVAEVQAKDQVQQALYKSIDRARRALKTMQGELAISFQKGKYMLSPESSLLVESGLNVAKMTKGSFNFVEGSNANGGVQINRKSGQLSVAQNNLRLNWEAVADGALADVIAEDLMTSGWGSFLIKVGPVFVSRGNDAGGPWKIPVAPPSNRLAKRVLLYKAKGEVGSATFPAGKGSVAVSDIISATIFTTHGAESQGLAQGLYYMGFSKAKNFVASRKNWRAVFTGSDGQFAHVPQFKAETSSLEAIPRTPARKKEKVEIVEKLSTENLPQTLKSAKKPAAPPPPLPEEEKVIETKPHTSAKTL